MSRRSHPTKIIVMVTAFIMMFALVVTGVASINAQGQARTTDAEMLRRSDPVGPQTTAASVQTDDVFAKVYNQVSPSVVAIAIEKPASTSLTFPGFGRQGSSQVERALGSGFVIDKQGHIVTNDHVVDGATTIEVAFADGTLAHAKIVGTDPDSDVAVIQVENVAEAKLNPVTFANSDELYVGESVLAIGSPFGERWTLTTGIVSGLDRLIKGLNNYSIGGVVQTDAAINPGNSGGPLLNLNGDVVGINAQIASDSGSNSGVGFAIPANLVQHVVPELIKQGHVDYSYIGLSGEDVTLAAIEAMHLPNDMRGVLVGDVANDGPAQRAGVKAAVTRSQGQQVHLTSADIITAINGQQLYGMTDLIAYLANHTHPGDTVTLTVLRNGTENVTLKVQLAKRPQQISQ